MSWNSVALGDICSIVNGGTPKSEVSEYWNGDLNWITPKEMGKLNSREIATTERKITEKGMKNSSARLLPVNSVILSSRAPIGHLAINKELMATNQGCKGLVPSASLNFEYLYHFLSYSKETLNDMGTGATFKELSGSKLKTLQIPLLPLATQKKIVTKLDAVFAEIDKAMAAAQSNAGNAEALFQSYMSKTFSECESLYSLSQLASICDLQNGNAFKSADYVEYSETLNIRMSSIRPGGFFNAEHNKRYLPDSYSEKYKEFLLKDGDLVIAMTDMAGDPKILGVPTIVKDLNDRKFLMNQRVGKLHKFSNSIHIPYLRYFLTSPKIKEFYKDKGDGGLQINISKKEILSAQIPLPPLTIQEKIGKEMGYVQSHSEKSKNIYLMKINEYFSLKQSILKQAFNGELVKE